MKKLKDLIKESWMTGDNGLLKQKWGNIELGKIYTDKDMKPFKSPSNIYFFPIDYKTGQDVSFSNKKAIIEAFKEKTVKEIKVKNLSIGENYGKYNKFRRFY